MPSDDEVSRIEADFARQYDLDLPGIRQDAQSLRAAVAGPVIDPLVPFYTYNGTQAFIPNLETIDPSQVVPDPRLSIRLIEANLEEATKYSQTCLQLQSHYEELARYRNDTRFKGEEFVRLDAVHLHEIDEGFYKLPWQEAADDVEGLELALAQANVQQSIPDAMTGAVGSDQKYASILTDQEMLNQIQTNAFIARNIANTLKDQVEQRSLSTAGYRTHMEYATWQETLAGAKATVAQLSAKLKIAKRKEDYLRKDESFKLQRAFISRQLAWLQVAEHARAGSALNYDERLRATKSLYDQNLRPLIERVVVLNDGLKQVYGIELPLDGLGTGGVLDLVAPWLAKASDAIAKWKRTQRLTLVQIVGDAKIASTPDGTNFETIFTVSESNLPSSIVLLRGINLEYIGDSRVPISVDVAPPAGVVLGGDTATLAVRSCLSGSSEFGIETATRRSIVEWITEGRLEGNWGSAIRLEFGQSNHHVSLGCFPMTKQLVVHDSKLSNFDQLRSSDLGEVTRREVIALGAAGLASLTNFTTLAQAATEGESGGAYENRSSAEQQQQTVSTDGNVPRTEQRVEGRAEKYSDITRLLGSEFRGRSSSIQALSSDQSYGTGTREGPDRLEVGAGDYFDVGFSRNLLSRSETPLATALRTLGEGNNSPVRLSRENSAILSQSLSPKAQKPNEGRAELLFGTFGKVTADLVGAYLTGAAGKALGASTPALAGLSGAGFKAFGTLIETPAREAGEAFGRWLRS